MEICTSLFSFTPEDKIKLKSKDLVLKYNKNLQEDLIDELQSFKKVYAPSFGHKQLNPLELLNHLTIKKVNGCERFNLPGTQQS